MTWFAGRNQVTAGAAFDHSAVVFTQMSQLGYLNPVTGVWSKGIDVIHAGGSHVNNFIGSWASFAAAYGVTFWISGGSSPTRKGPGRS